VVPLDAEQPDRDGLATTLSLGGGRGHGQEAGKEDITNKSGKE